MVPAKPSRNQPHAHPAQVQPGWLLGALGLLVLAALACAYISLCALFAQGQWQLLYQPHIKSSAPRVPVDGGLGFTAVRFGPNEAGVSELDGWWLPASINEQRAGTTVLYLHDRLGLWTDALPEIARLHALGCSVFAIEYRGYEAQPSEHPSEQRMIQAADQALAYLVQTRHIPVDSIVLWGRGSGATIAAEATHQSTLAPSIRLVLEEVNPPASVLLGADPRTRFLPLRLLLRDHLDPVQALQGSQAPKLFLTEAPLTDPATHDLQTGGESTATKRLYFLAAAPKQLADTTDQSTIRSYLSVRHTP